MKKILGLCIITTLLFAFLGCKDIFGSDDDDHNEEQTNENIAIYLNSPISGATNQPINVTFQWTGTATTYDLYLGNSSYNLSKIASNLSNTSYTKYNLDYKTKYYWKVVGKKGSESNESSIRNFTTENNETSVNLSSPTNGATNQTTSITLTWTGNAEKYDVYFGTSSSSLSRISSNITSNSYTKSNLNYLTTYYWKVVAKGDENKTSDIWSFTTKKEGNSINIDLNLVLVKAGSFQMGSSISSYYSSPIHTVTISNDFYIGKYEVTNEEVVKVYNWARNNISGLSFSSSSVSYNGNELLDLNDGGCQIGLSNGYLYVKNYKEKYPAVEITWYGAKAYADFLNVLFGTNKYKLPTEAEWEFAFRGGNNSKGYTYSGSNTIGNVAWYKENTSSTNKVGQKNANELGIYDMSGNVWELCSDWYNSYSSGSQIDPTGPNSGTTRVRRGGCFVNSSVSCRFDFRYGSSSLESENGVGFRLACAKDGVSVFASSPANAATNQSTNVTLTWTGTASTYDVYMGTTSSSLSRIASGLSGNSYTKTGLNYGTTYYWKVIGKKDGKSGESEIRSFTTKTEEIDVNLTSPTNGATNQDLSINLSWTGNAEYYEVYLGTSLGSYSKIATNITANNYILSSLNYGTTYYWKVIGKKDSKITESSVRNFSTKMVNSIGMEFVLVEAGTFMMGSTSGDSDEKPVHQVTLTKDYYIGKYEVTQKQWVAVMGSNPSNWKGDNLPVEQVSWNDIQEFITKLNQKEGTDKYRLPTEAEWEFVARGGNKSKGYTYSGSNSIGEIAWYEDNAGGKTHEVGTKKANELGIYDMSGNVGEWCSDLYGAYSSAAVSDPTGASRGSYRVCRGGFWLVNDPYCRVVDRRGTNPSYRLYYDGFRIVMEK